MTTNDMNQLFLEDRNMFSTCKSPKVQSHMPTKSCFDAVHRISLFFFKGAVNMLDCWNAPEIQFQSSPHVTTKCRPACGLRSLRSQAKVIAA